MTLYGERRFTAETQSTQSWEYCSMKTFTLRPPRLGGEVSESWLHRGGVLSCSTVSHAEV